MKHGSSLCLEHGVTPGLAAIAVEVKTYFVRLLHIYLFFYLHLKRRTGFSSVGTQRCKQSHIQKLGITANNNGGRKRGKGLDQPQNMRRIVGGDFRFSVFGLQSGFAAAASAWFTPIFSLFDLQPHNSMKNPTNFSDVQENNMFSPLFTTSCYFQLLAGPLMCFEGDKKQGGHFS